jgi:hypothetical protein
VSRRTLAIVIVSLLAVTLGAPPATPATPATRYDAVGITIF